MLVRVRASSFQSICGVATMRWQGRHLWTRTALRSPICGKLPSGIISRSHFSHTGDRLESLFGVMPNNLSDPRVQRHFGILRKRLYTKVAELYHGA